MNQIKLNGTQNSVIMRFIHIHENHKSNNSNSLSLTHSLTSQTHKPHTHSYIFPLINSPYLINNLVQIKKEKNVKTETLAFERNAKTKTKTKRKKGRTKY